LSQVVGHIVEEYKPWLDYQGFALDVEIETVVDPICWTKKSLSLDGRRH